MKSLTFENALGNQVVFSGTGTYRWMNVDDLGGLSASFQTTSSPYQDGETSLDNGYFGSKLISIDFVIRASDALDAMRDLNFRVNPKLGEGKLIWNDGVKDMVYNSVKTKVMPTFNKKFGSDYLFSTIIFEVFDPLFQDKNFSSYDVYSQIDNFTFDLAITEDFVFDQVGPTITITNVGDVQAPIIVEFTGVQNAPLTVMNLTTGENIVVNMSLTADQKLTINTDLNEIDVKLTTISTGVVTSAFQYIDVVNTKFFQLALGANVLKFMNGAQLSQYVNVKYKNRYVGV